MTDHQPILRSQATVTTDRGERWRKQLASHFGRKCEVREEGAATTLVLAGGTCTLAHDDTTLHLTATGPDAETLTRVQHVVGGHLERFAARENLRVVWLPAS